MVRICVLAGVAAALYGLWLELSPPALTRRYAERGRRDAERDIASGRFAIRTYGLMAPPFHDYTGLLRDRYGVHVYHGG